MSLLIIMLGVNLVLGESSEAVPVLKLDSLCFDLFLLSSDQLSLLLDPQLKSLLLIDVGLS